MFRRMLRGILAAAILALAFPSLAVAAPVAVGTATPDRGGAPLTVVFDASSSSPADSYAWNFGDGTTGAGVTVSHEYASAGSYSATLTVTAGVETASTSVPVVVQNVTLLLGAAETVYGHVVSAAGTVTPAEAGLGVTLEQFVGGIWTVLGTAVADGAGAFGTAFTATGGGAVRARLDDGGALSPENPLSVAPDVALTLGRGKAFMGAPLQATVLPASYVGQVQISVGAAGHVLARKSAAAAAGHLATRVPTPWAGAVNVRIDFPSSGALASLTITRKIAVDARTLRRGSRGPAVRALTRRLAQLKVHVLPTSVFGPATYDSVIAFQKARGLSRTGVVDTRTWRALGLTHRFRARYTRPTPHIEIDKSRQILMVVKRGVVTGLIPVSTGATGNTPVGAFRILWKAPATGTWLGSATLYRTMTFHGNFAIHGYYSVPPWPASHGCVRVPLWAADWLYVQSPVGERIYIYD
jgi:PKD repeat protein